MVSKLKKKIISSGPMPHGRGKFKKPKSGTSVRKVLPYKYKKPLVKKQFAGRIARDIKKRVLTPLKEAALKKATAASASQAGKKSRVKGIAKTKSAQIEKAYTQRLGKLQRERSKINAALAQPNRVTGKVKSQKGASRGIKERISSAPEKKHLNAQLKRIDEQIMYMKRHTGAGTGSATAGMPRSGVGSTQLVGSGRVPRARVEKKGGGTVMKSPIIKKQAAGYIASAARKKIQDRLKAERKEARRVKAAKRLKEQKAAERKAAKLAEKNRLAAIAKRKSAGKRGLLALGGVGLATLAGKATYDVSTQPKTASAKSKQPKKMTYEPKKHVVPSKSKSYSVKGGDSLSMIAKRQGTTLKALLAANPSITDPNKIRVGQKIKMSAPVKGRKSVYQGLSKSRMAGMAMPKKRATGGKVMKKQVGGRMDGQGYGDRERESIAMRLRKKRTPAQLRASADESYGKFGRGTGTGVINRRKGKAIKITKIPEHKPRKKLDKPYRKRSADPVVRQHGGKIKGPVKITKYPEHKPRKNYGKKRIGRSADPVRRKSGGTLLVASMYD